MQMHSVHWLNTSWSLKCEVLFLSGRGRGKKRNLTLFVSPGFCALLLWFLTYTGCVVALGNVLSSFFFLSPTTHSWRECFTYAGCAVLLLIISIYLSIVSIVSFFRKSCSMIFRCGWMLDWFSSLPWQCHMYQHHRIICVYMSLWSQWKWNSLLW